ncbi:MAG TPA: hypothetical protein VEW66_01425, partial [Thermomicrobiales bacterium]|nr:hypothetical protein [Thermomicrobiales bacterium]
KAGDVNGWFWTGTRPPEPAMSLQDIANQLDVQVSEADSAAIVRTFGTLPNDEASKPSSTAFIASALLLTGLAAASMFAVRRAKAS